MTPFHQFSSAAGQITDVMSASDTILINCPWEFECRFYKQKKEIKVSLLSKLADITVSTYIVYVFIKIFIINIFKLRYCIKNIKL